MGRNADHRTKLNHFVLLVSMSFCYLLSVNTELLFGFLGLAVDLLHKVEQVLDSFVDNTSQNH